MVIFNHMMKTINIIMGLTLFIVMGGFTFVVWNNPTVAENIIILDADIVVQSTEPTSNLDSGVVLDSD